MAESKSSGIVNMQANLIVYPGREERFLMRQRGAGTRDIVLAFDLDLPGVSKPSKTPLKPQKSARERRSSPSKTIPPRSTRKTPIPAKTVLPSLSKRTPATARRRKPPTATGGAGSIGREPMHDPKVSETPQSNSGGISTRKRKATEDLLRTQATASSKRPRKRKSIGQQSSRRKLKASSASTGTIALHETTSRLRRARGGTKNPNEASAELSNPDAKEHGGLVNLPGGVEEQVQARALKKPRSRKQSSIKQTQRPDSSRTTAQGSGDDAVELAQSAQIPAGVETIIEHEAADTEMKANPRKRKRKAIVQNAKKRKKVSPVKILSLILEQVVEKPKIPLQESAPIQKPTNKASLEKPAKRGRKPKVTTKDHPEVIIEAPEAVVKVPKTEESHLELQPQCNQDLPAPKRKRKKRKSIGQVQRPRNRDTTTTSNILLDTESKHSDVEIPATSNEVMSVPAIKRKGHSETLPESLTNISNDQLASKDYHDLPMQAPKRRGRPKKMTSSAPAAKLDETSDHPIEVVDVNDIPLNSVAMKPFEPVASVEPAPSFKEPDIQELPQIVKPQPQKDTKKRGRPKKQVSTTFLPEPLAQGTIPPKVKSKMRRTAARPRSTSTKPRQMTIKSSPETLEQPIQVAAHDQDQEDYDDPLSNIEAVLSKDDETTRSINQPEPRGKTSHGDFDSTINGPMTGRSTGPNPQPPATRRHPFQKSNKKPALEPPENNTVTDLASHLRASRAEEQSLRKDLIDLQAQQAREMEEQKERDLAARLESLSASVKKRKLAASLMPAGTGGREKERRVGSGWEKFVFRTVKRKKLEREEEEEAIDPELQDLLSNVKGVANKGGGSVMKLF